MWGKAARDMGFIQEALYSMSRVNHADEPELVFGHVRATSTLSGDLTPIRSHSGTSLK